jgi:hypothetical protein
LRRAEIRIKVNLNKEVHQDDISSYVRYAILIAVNSTIVMGMGKEAIK